MTDHKFMQAMGFRYKRVVLGGAINLVLTVITAFALSQDETDFPARKVYMWFMIFAMLFGASLVPWYFVIKATGLMDTIWALVIPSTSGLQHLILLMNFLQKSSQGDQGVGHAGRNHSIPDDDAYFVPLAKPAIAPMTRVFPWCSTGTTSSMAFC